MVSIGRLMRCVFALCIALLFAAGCSRVQADQLTIYGLQSLTTVGNGSMMTITDPAVVGQFVNAINSAKQEPGVVNMADPEYKLVLGEHEYFLWIDETSGTVMNVKNTPTIYTLSTRSAEQVYRVISEHYITN